LDAEGQLPSSVKCHVAQSTARAGGIACIATRVHSGRTTQVWDARVSTDEGGRFIALFRCTQMILYPRATP